MPKSNNLRFTSHGSGPMYNQGAAHANSLGTTSRIDAKNSGNVDTFWTICPYCYNAYEYSKVYQDCVFKCQNVTCRKVFHGVPLGVAPPKEVVEKGKYFCPGFVMLSGGEDEDGGAVWNPFGVLGSFPSGKKEKEVEKVCVEISDDEVEGYQVVGHEKKSKKSIEKDVEGVGVCLGGGIEEKDVRNMGKVFMVGDVEKEEGGSGKKVYRTRIKKSVPRSSRKFMGKGVRVKRNEVYRMDDVEVGGRKEGGESLGCGSMSNVMNVETEAAGLEIDMRDDDIFVGLQDIIVGAV